METLFIKNIVNGELLNKMPSINTDGIFSVDNKQEQIIRFENNNFNDEYEFILNIDNINNDDLNEEEEKAKNDYILSINEEYKKITSIIKYIIANIDIEKVIIPDYKIYDYSNVPKNLKSKIKSHNHIFDAKKFIMKNNIDKTNINAIISKMKNKDLKDSNELKIIAFFIIIKIMDILDKYNKCLLYSLELLKEYPYVFRYKDDYLLSINDSYFTITDNNITLMHYNIIKNAFIKNNNDNKKSSIINISKNKNNNYEIIFK